MASAGAKLRGLYRGRFRGVKVLTRGSSPRIVAANVVGSAGRTRVNGADAARPARAVRQLGVLHLDQHRQGAAAAAGEDAGAGRRARARHRGPRAAACSRPVRAPRSRSSAGSRGRWVTVGTAETRRGGRYHAGVPAAGLYRIVFRGDAGPAVRAG